MLHRRSRIGRHAIAFIFLATLLALAPPAAQARVHVGIGVNIALPPHVHVSVGNYEPYYVGRVFYRPAAVWRPVYSFPVETPYGIEYAPYVYDRDRVVCQDYIPGYEAGYGQFVIEGRGRYRPEWYRGSREYHAYNRYDSHRDRGWHGHPSGHDRGRGHGHDRGGGKHRKHGNGHGRH